MAAARNSFAIVGGPSTGKSRLLGKCARAVTLISAAPSKTLILCTDEEVCCEEGREEGMRREDDE